MKMKSQLLRSRRLVLEPLERRELLAAQPLPLTPPAGYDQGGLYPAGTTTDITYYSPSQNANDKMTVYLPPGYNPSQKYGVIYGYPGIGAGEDTIFAGWCVDAGGLVDNLVGQGKIKGVIVVGIDDNNGDVQSDTLNVIIPYIDSHYSTYADADHRGLYGYSWGGGYTFNIGCGNLNTFHYLSPSSAAPDKNSDDSLFPNGGAQAKQSLKTLLISVGTADYLGLYGPSQASHNYCNANNIPNAWFPVLNGNHDAGVWRAAMWNFLQMADTAGISTPPVPKSAFAQIEAENYDIQSGVSVESCSDTGGGQDVGSIQNGAYLVFNNVDFGSGANSFSARVASAGSGGNIELHLDSPTGTLVGTCSAPVTGGWQTWQTQSCSVSGATGTHNLYLKFTGGSGYLFNVNWWKFSASSLPAKPAAPTGLTATAGVEQATLSWTAVSTATSYNVKRATTSGGPYTTIATVAATSYIDRSALDGTTYYYVVSALNTGGESTTNSSQVSALPTANVPSPWLTRDVGTPGLAGGASLTSAVFTVIGSGADIGGSNDAFRFVDESTTGDCTIIARVASLDTYIDGGSKAGVMLRESMAANAANVFIGVTASNGVTFQYRSSTGGATTSSSASGPAAPYWVKLVRSGNTFTGSYSSDGTNWTQAGSATFTMASTAYLGLAVTAHNDNTLCTATFDSVTAPGWVHPRASTPYAVVATPGANQVSLSWAPASNADTYIVQRATAKGGPYTTIATVTAANYTDTQVLSGATFYYEVMAVSNMGGSSDNSTPAQVTLAATMSSPWMTGDIGGPAISGSANQSNGTFTLKGSGSDIWNSADAFRFACTSTTSTSFTAVARVASLQNTDSWAKAGLMVRDSLDPAAANALIAVTPGNGVTFQYRTSDGGGCSNTTTSGSAPEWVKLVVSGTTITGYCSSDGTNWTQVGSVQNMTMAATTYIGMAVTSHNNSSLCTATFDNVTVPGWQSLLATATAVTSGQVNVTWDPQSGATSYNLKRATTSGGPYTTIASGLTGASYTDTSVNLASTRYYYVVSAIVSGSETANGPEAAVIFPQLSGAVIGTSGSYNNWGNTIDKVFDGDLTTYFDGPSSDGCWAGLDFGAGASSVITQINYCPRSGYEARMEGGVFQGANQANFSDAVTLYTVPTAAQPATGALTSASISNTTAFRYVRYLSPSGSWGNVAEVQFFGPTMTAPSAPKGLVAGGVSSSQINVTWNTVQGATSYNVKRAATSGGPYTTVATGVTGTGYADTGLSAATYYYVVSAVNSSGESANSAQVSATTIAPPTVVTAAAASPSTVSGTTTALSVLGGPSGNEAGLTYTWATTGTPPAAVAFSANGTNAAKNTTATFSQAGSYTFQVTIANASGLSVTSSVSVTVSQTLTSITVTPATAVVLPNGTKSFSATAYDQFGTAMTSQPTITWASSGIGSVNSGGLYTAPGTTGTASVRAASGSVGGTAAVTVATAPTVATAASATPSPVTGKTTALSVLGADATGEANLTYTWALAGTPPASVTFSANGSNAAKNTTATFAKAGNYTFQVTITNANGLSTTSSVSVTVSQTATSIAVSPSVATVAPNAQKQFLAVGYDQFGNTCSAPSGVTWSVANSSLGSIGASTGLFTAGTLQGATTVTATVGAWSSSATVNVSTLPAPLAWYRFDDGSGSTAADSSGNNLSAALSGSYSFASGVSGGALSLTGGYAGLPTAMFTNVNDFTVAGWVNLSSLDNWARIFDFGTGTTTNMFLTPSAGDTGKPRFAITTGGGGSEQRIDSSVAMTTNTWTFVAVTLSGTTATLYINGAVVGTNTSMTLNPASLGVTNQNYLGKSQYPDPALNGSLDDVRIYSSALSAANIATLMNLPPTVATAAAASPSPAGGTTTNLSVLGADDGGESNLKYTWSATGPAAVTFSANGNNAAKTTTATFTKAGSYSFVATIVDAYGQFTTSSVNITVSQTLTSIAVSPSSVSLGSHAAQQFTATARDQFGAAMSTQPNFNWAASGAGGINTSSGLYTASNASGTATVTAASGSVTSPAASVTITDAVPTVATIAKADNASPDTVAGKTASLSVLGADADGGGELNLTYVWSVTGPTGVSFSSNNSNAAKSTTATFTQAGSYVFTATIADLGGQSTTSSVSVTVNQTLTSIAVSPTSASLGSDGTQSFAATAYDQFGAAMSTQPSFTWALASGAGSIDSSSGIYTASYASGAATVTAASGSVTSPAASVTVTDAAPTVATVATASPATATTMALSVLGADSDGGGEGNLRYTWSITSKPTAAADPTFSANGTNVAKNTTATFTQAGAYSFTVTITDLGEQSTTSSVTVNVLQTLTSIAISPSAASISAGATQQFVATASDQFGDAMATQPSWTWSCSPGQISSSGLYSPAYAYTPAPATVQVTDGSLPLVTATVKVTGQAQWNSLAPSSWATGNWIDSVSTATIAAPGLRGIAGDTVAFVSSAGATASLDGANPSIAGITFENTATGCNIVEGTTDQGAGTLHLQNAMGPANIVVGGGQQTIGCPVQLDSNLTVSPVFGSVLRITGPISGSGSLTVNDHGKLVLGGANSLTSVTVTSGTLVLDAANSIADGASLTVGAASAFNSPTVVVNSAAALDSLTARPIAAAPRISPAAATAPSAVKSLSPRAVAAVMTGGPLLPLWIRRAAAANRTSGLDWFAASSPSIKLVQELLS